MPRRQARVLLFVHDGTGFGHLRRAARIAAEMQGPAATLLVTGMREAGWMLLDECEFVHLPSWDSVRPDRAARRGHAVWMQVPRDEALRLRRDLLWATFQAFAPDAVLVDYLPFGHWGELRECLAACPARKYFVLRGIVDSSDRESLHGAKARAAADWLLPRKLADG